MKNFFSVKNTLFTGLLLALSVVFTDYLNSYATGHPMSTNALIVAAGIAAVGFLGRFMTGVANTNVAMIGSAVLAILPMLTDGIVDWRLLIATFIVKLIGVFTAGVADIKPADKPPAFYDNRR